MKIRPINQEDATERALAEIGHKLIAYPENGDLVVLPDGGGWILAEVIGLDENRRTIVAWGDSQRTIDTLSSMVMSRDEMLPATGKFIGRRFESVSEARATLLPYRRKSPVPASTPAE